MKLTQLRKIHDPAAAGAAEIAPMRGTQAQDAPVSTPGSLWRRHRLRFLLAAAALIALLFAWLIHAWLGMGEVISRERLRTATVTRGHFLRDVAAEGTVVASVNPTLFAVAGGTVSYVAHAGDTVKKGQTLVMLDSPELTNEYQREQATLDSLDAALARQQIEIRRQMLTSQQQADLA